MLTETEVRIMVIDLASKTGMTRSSFHLLRLIMGDVKGWAVMFDGDRPNDDPVIVVADSGIGGVFPAGTSPVQALQELTGKNG